MNEAKRTVIFTRDGVTVQEERETPLTEETKTVTVDELSWSSFPMDLLMEVTSVEPVPSEDDETLSELRFGVSRLERSSRSSADFEGKFWERVEESTGIRYEDGDVSLSGERNAKDNLVIFVQFLINQGYLTRDDLPVKSGWKRYLISTDPTHQQGDEMVQDEEVAEGIFLETKYSRKDIKKKIRELGDRFGE